MELLGSTFVEARWKILSGTLAVTAGAYLKNPVKLWCQIRENAGMEFWEKLLKKFSKHSLNKSQNRMKGNPKSWLSACDHRFSHNWHPKSVGIAWITSVSLFFFDISLGLLPYHFSGGKSCIPNKVCELERKNPVRYSAKKLVRTTADNPKKKHLEKSRKHLREVWQKLWQTSRWKY